MNLKINKNTFLILLAILLRTVISHAAQTISVQNGFITRYIDINGASTIVNSPQISLSAGATVFIQADPAPERLTFDQWKGPESVKFRAIKIKITSFIVPAEDVVVTATYRKFQLKVDSFGSSQRLDLFSGENLSFTASDPSPTLGFYAWLFVPVQNPLTQQWTSTTVFTPTVAFEMPPYDTAIIATYGNFQTLTVTNGLGSGKHVQNSWTTITADAPTAGKTFDHWEADLPNTQFEQGTSATTRVRMPTQDLKVTAVYREIPVVYSVSIQNGFVERYIDSNGDNKNIHLSQLTLTAGTTVFIQANPSPSHLTFGQWEGPASVKFQNSQSTSTLFVMPKENISITAANRKFHLKVDSFGSSKILELSSGETTTVFANNPAVNNLGFYAWLFVPVQDPLTHVWTSTTVFNSTVTLTMPPYDTSILAVYDYYQTLTVIHGAPSGKYVQNTWVTITADAPESGKVFDHWESDLQNTQFEQGSLATTRVRMPTQNLKVTAVYRELPVFYHLKVIDGLILSNGLSEGDFTAGSTITVQASAFKNGSAFERWASSSSIEFAEINDSSTTFIMPASAVVVQALYREAGFLPTPVNDGFVDFDNVIAPNRASTIQITYFLNNADSVSLNIYNLRGDLVRSLNATSNQGVTNSVTWDGTNDDGTKVSTDVYLLILKIGETLYRTKVSVIN